MAMDVFGKDVLYLIMLFFYYILRYKSSFKIHILRTNIRLSKDWTSLRNSYKIKEERLT